VTWFPGRRADISYGSKDQSLNFQRTCKSPVFRVVKVVPEQSIKAVSIEEAR
jgi:hypothetical protein